MRFVGQLLFHVARVIAGLLAVVALTVALIVGWWMYGVKQKETASEVAETLKQDSAAPTTLTEGEATSSVRVVTPAVRPQDTATTGLTQPANEPPAPRIDAIGRIDQATRDYFDKVTYLAETGTRHNPKSCDDVIDWVLWISLYETVRSEMMRDEFSTSEALGFFLTMGASHLVAQGNERWTIFSAESQGRYVTFTLGAPRRDTKWDLAGGQTRMTFYRMDDKRIGLVEQAALGEPPMVRPAKKAPKILRVYLVCRAKP